MTVPSAARCRHEPGRSRGRPARQGLHGRRAGTGPGRNGAPTGGARPVTKTALRHRLAERGVDRTLLLLIPGLLFLLVLFLYPFLYGLGLSFQPTKGGGPLADYQRFFHDPYLRGTIWITLKIGLPAALLNVVASVP